MRPRVARVALVALLALLTGACATPYQVAEHERQIRALQTDVRALKEAPACCALPTVTTTPPTLEVGKTITINVDNGPGNVRDWVGLFLASDPDTAREKTWVYLSNTQTPPAAGLKKATVTLKAVATGDYVVKFLANDTYTVLARSEVIKVTPPKSSGGGVVPIDSPALAALVGPLAPVKSDLAFDTFHIETSRAMSDRYPSNVAPPTSMARDAANYYDHALVAYRAYYRTGAVDLRDGARHIVHDYVANNPPSPGRAGATLGPAIAALEAGDAAARTYVKAAADQAKYHLDNYDNLTAWKGRPIGGDAREGAYELMTVIAAYLLGQMDRSVADRMVDIFDRTQDKAGGQCQSSLPGCWYDGWGMNNFMAGLALEAFAFYDRVFPGNPKIRPMMELTATFLWGQWKSDGQGGGSFNYCTYNWPDGSCYADVSANTPGMNGLFLTGWGHLLTLTGNEKYRTQGDQILRGAERQMILLDCPRYPTCVDFKIGSETYRASTLYRTVGP